METAGLARSTEWLHCSLRSCSLPLTGKHYIASHRVCESYNQSFFWHCDLSHLPCQLFKPCEVGALVGRASNSPIGKLSFEKVLVLFVTIPHCSRLQKHIFTLPVFHECSCRLSQSGSNAMQAAVQCMLHAHLHPAFCSWASCGNGL